MTIVQKFLAIGAAISVGIGAAAWYRMQKSMEFEFVDRMKSAHGCEPRRAVLSDINSVVREAQLIGKDLDELEKGLANNNIEKFAADMLYECVREAFDKCYKNHDLSQVAVIQQLLTRQVQILNLPPSDDPRLDKPWVENCMSFEMEMDAETNWPTGAGRITPQARAVIPLELQIDGSSGAGHYRGASMPTVAIPASADAGCSGTTYNVTGPSPVEVENLVIIADSTKRGAATELIQEPQAIKFMLNPASVLGDYRFRCEGNDNAIETTVSGMYTAAFASLLKEEFVQQPNRYLYSLRFDKDDIRSYRTVKDGVYARKEISRSNPHASLRLVLTLWHRPKAIPNA